MAGPCLPGQRGCASWERSCGARPGGCWGPETETGAGKPFLAAWAWGLSALARPGAARFSSPPGPFCLARAHVRVHDGPAWGAVQGLQAVTPLTGARLRGAGAGMEPATRRGEEAKVRRSELGVGGSQTSLCGLTQSPESSASARRGQGAWDLVRCHEAPDRGEKVPSPGPRPRGCSQGLCSGRLFSGTFLTPPTWGTPLSCAHQPGAYPCDGSRRPEVPACVSSSSPLLSSRGGDYTWGLCVPGPGPGARGVPGF